VRSSAPTEDMKNGHNNKNTVVHTTKHGEITPQIAVIQKDEAGVEVQLANGAWSLLSVKLLKIQSLRHVHFFLGWGMFLVINRRRKHRAESCRFYSQESYMGGESTHLSPMVDQRRETEIWRETSLTGNVARSRGQGQCCHVTCNKSTNAGGYINTREHTLARLCVHTIHIEIRIKHNTEYIVQAMNNA